MTPAMGPCHLPASKAAGPNAQSIHNLQWPVFLVAGIVGVLVFLAIGWVVFRYRDRGQPIPKQTHGNPKLEIGLTILPALILVGVASHVMARPDDADELLGGIERARILNEALDNVRLRRLAGLPGGLPSLPPLYLDLVDALQGPDATLEKHLVSTEGKRGVALLDKVKDLGVQLVVLGFSGRNKLRDFVTGTLTQHVLATGSEMSVLVAH